MTTRNEIIDSESQDDSLVGVPTHPVAVGTGAVVVGAAAGAAAGTIAGPVGALAGAALGAVVGGMGGDAVAQSVEDARDGDSSRDPSEARLPVEPLPNSKPMKRPTVIE